MSNQLESALVIALRNTIKWESSTVTSSSGTLTPVDPDLPFDSKTYQARDRQLAYRDLIVGAAVVEVSVQVGDVWNYSSLKPGMQGPAEFTLPFVGTESGTVNSQVRHVTNVSIPYDAARYADADLYGRDAIIYEVLARACQSTFVDPSIPVIDTTGTVIPSTSVWSLAEGVEQQTDINAVLPLDRALFKKPDQNLADRDNQLAGYVAQLAQVLKNPFQHALRLYVQIEAYGTVQREPDIYALTSDDGTNRVFQTEPALPGANQIIYSTSANTLQWIRERVDEIHVPQIYAMEIPGIEIGQTIETLAEVPQLKDAQYWRGKAGQLEPEGIVVSDTSLYLTNTNSDATVGGYDQYGSASLTVAGAMTFNMAGSLPPGDYRISVLTKPNNRVEVAGAQNTSNTSGTLGGATFDINVQSGSISDKVYLVEDGNGIVYNGSVYLPGELFAGTTADPTYSQYGAVPSTIRQFSINFLLALPAGAWTVSLEYTNLSGFTDSFSIKGEYVASGADAVPVIQDVAPIPFTTTNGNILITAPAFMDVADTGQFSFPIYWTGGDGELHIRKLVFQSEVEEGRFAVTGTFAGSVAQVDVIGDNQVPGVMRFQYFADGSIDGTVPFTMNYTDDSTLPLQIQQVQIQALDNYIPTPLGQGFQGWRKECLDRATRVIVQGYNNAVAAYGTDVPTFRAEGSYWTPDLAESWMSFVEVFNPRVREIPGIAFDGIIGGYQYEVTTPSATYDGTVYTTGQKFYGVESAGTVYSGGTVNQVGAFQKSKPGHIGLPCLMPLGVYFDETDKMVKAYYDTPLSIPIITACQAWMVEYGFYVVQEEFWMPETLGLSLPSDVVSPDYPAPVAFFVGSPVLGDFPLLVDFTNLSTGAQGATFHWDFGD